MATSPTGRQHPPLPAPPRQTLRRLTPEEVMQPTKAQKTSKDTTIRSTEPPPLRQKINAVTLPNRKSITPYTNDDTSEDQPIIFDNEGYDETQLLEGMKHESNQMKLHDVYDEVDASTVDDNVIREAIPTRWVYRKDQEYEAESSQKATQRRSRTKTPSTPLHQCSRHSGHFSRTTPLSRPSRSRSYSSTSATSNLANHNIFLEETSTTSATTATLD